MGNPPRVVSRSAKTAHRITPLRTLRARRSNLPARCASHLCPLCPPIADNARRGKKRCVPLFCRPHARIPQLHAPPNCGHCECSEATSPPTATPHSRVASAIPAMSGNKKILFRPSYTGQGRPLTTLPPLPAKQPFCGCRRPERPGWPGTRGSPCW